MSRQPRLFPVALAWLLPILLGSGCGRGPSARGEETVAYDLVQRFPAAQIMTASKGDGEDAAKDASTDGPARTGTGGISQPAGSEIRFALRVPEGARLSLRTRVQGAGWLTGARFLVTAEPSGGETLTLLDRKQRKIRGAVARDLPLAGLEGQATRISFKVEADNPATAGVWEEPAILAPPPPATIPASGREAQARLQEAARGKNLLVVLLDAARADHFGCYGYTRRPTTPRIDEIASRSVLFESVTSQAAYTLASVGTILTGLYPPAHGAVFRNDKLAAGWVTLAEMMKGLGMRTASFTASPNSSSAFGYDQGFDLMVETYRVDREFIHDQEGPGDLVGRFFEWVGEPGGGRFFAYLHVRQPHQDYNAPAPFAGRFDPDYTGPAKGDIATIEAMTRGGIRSEKRDREHLDALYDENLAYADDWVGRIADHLKETGLWDETILVLLSDHGEAFWEHKVWGHNATVYEETVRVPLVVRLPGVEGLAGQRVKGLVELADLTPTLAALLESSPPPYPFGGESLLPALADPSGWRGKPFVHTQTAWGSKYSVRDERWKVIVKARKAIELYDLANDPAEKVNLARKNPVERDVLLQQYLVWRAAEDQRHTFVAGEDAKSHLDQKTLEELKALGYVQ